MNIEVFINSVGEISIMKNSDTDPCCVSFPKEVAEEICNAILESAIELGKRNGTS